MPSEFKMLHTVINTSVYWLGVGTQPLEAIHTVTLANGCEHLEIEKKLEYPIRRYFHVSFDNLHSFFPQVIFSDFLFFFKFQTKFGS